ncbi:MAG: TrmH family RNA methyltransferase [Chitinophagia bacterium]|jgi:tRNA G18 (ribose-2'-O)-methylase SpoU|nr:TrmH family RNA methyltransferase [Chitinophagia bacterium]NCA30508.1 TrmH family RNA methyltransferase [Chitinophagia bacterium]
MRKLTMDELGRKSVSDFKLADKKPLVVVMDNIRSMHNVGSVFRTADAFLIEGICLCGFTPQPPHRDIQKTALGATESVDWLYYENTISAVEALKEQGYKVFAIEQTQGSISLENFKTYINENSNNSLNNSLAFVFGNEVEGVSEEVLAICDGAVEIPQYGMKHSLNISVAAAIVLWEMVR